MSIVLRIGGAATDRVTTPARPAMMAGGQRNARIPNFSTARDTGAMELYDAILP